jgi:hypothetical protein
MEGIVAMRSGHLIAFWIACVWPLTIADARTLEVGPGKAFALPSQAAEAARDGDVVQIAPGNYVVVFIRSAHLDPRMPKIEHPAGSP